MRVRMPKSSAKPMKNSPNTTSGAMMSITVGCFAHVL